jgi:glycosyltransferase involved in cell wall biosynthesis
MTETKAAHSRSLESLDAGTWPPIVLITPVYNSAEFIEQTIRSVVAQGYPNLEYFIIDGGSTDGSVEIIRSYEKEITGWISEPDRGMYDALNKGFARSTNDLMGWISATDVLHPYSLFVVGSVFRSFPDVEWITGVPTVVDELGMTVEVQPLPHWSRTRVLMGANRHIQQESTFWRRSLWEKAGGRAEDSLRNGGDFELWLRFFRHAQLYSVDALVGAFRLHGDSLAWSNAAAYNKVIDDAVEAELARIPSGSWIRAFRRLSDTMARTPGCRRFWKDVVMRSLYRLPGSDWPPTIESDPGRGWRIKK